MALPIQIFPDKPMKFYKESADTIMTEITVDVTQGHINKGIAGHNKYCPVALAITDRLISFFGTEDVWCQKAGSGVFTAVRKRPFYHTLSLSAGQAMRDFEDGKTLVPFSFTINVSRNFIWSFCEKVYINQKDIDDNFFISTKKCPIFLSATERTDLLSDIDETYVDSYIMGNCLRIYYKHFGDHNPITYSIKHHSITLSNELLDFIKDIDVGNPVKPDYFDIELRTPA